MLQGITKLDISGCTPQNDSSPRTFADFGIFVFTHPHTILFVAVSIIALQLSRESNIGLLGSTFISSRLLKTKAGKALPDLIFVTLAGMNIEVRDEQPRFVAYIDNQRVASNTVEKCWRCDWRS